MGYDISDYEKVYPPYGSVKDMEDLIEACHKRRVPAFPSQPMLAKSQQGV
jgi:1,4-alpha-glucan branching enzyme